MLKEIAAGTQNALESYVIQRTIFELNSDWRNQSSLMMELSTKAHVWNKIPGAMVLDQPDDSAIYQTSRPYKLFGPLVEHGRLFLRPFTTYNNAVEAKAIMTAPGMRMRMIIWNAYCYMMGDMNNIYGMTTSDFGIEWSGTEAHTSGEHPQNWQEALKQLGSIESLTREAIMQGTVKYKRQLNRLELTIGQVDAVEKDTGIDKVLKGGPVAEGELTTLVENQIQAAISKMPTNALTSRTWGFEIESPDAKNVSVAYGSGIEKGEDGSLRSYESNSECDCDCNECTYHYCDCDNCSDQNEDPDHCGDSECETADMAEYRSVGGIQRYKHAGMIKLCKELTEAKAEINDSAGTHVHVYAADLTTHQVAQVMGIYSRLSSVYSVIAGRRDVSYSRDVHSTHVRYAMRKNKPALVAEKARSVNVSQLFTNRGTIEFRQMDCNYNGDRLTLWAWLMRGLVETVKRGAKLHNFLEVMDLDGIIATYAKYNFHIDNENPDVIVYGTKSDANSFVKTDHVQTS